MKNTRATIFDLSKLDEYVDKGLLRKSEQGNLVQYNYSEKTNNQKLWDNITLFNRGNIYEKTSGKLIAKSFPKFFNFDQLDETQKQHFLYWDDLIITEKKDGCLGLLYKYNNEIRYNSRGSFNNYVTDEIAQILPKYNIDVLDHLLDNKCLIVEVVSPKTKIICDYGEECNLYLLSGYTNLGSYWEEMSIDMLDYIAKILNMPRPQYYKYTWQELFDWQQKANWEKEGFVVTINTSKYGSFERVKIKSDEYLKIASLKSNLDKHYLWKIMKLDLKQNQNNLTKYMESCPDELYSILLQHKSELDDELAHYRNLSMDLYEQTKQLTDKELGLFFAKNKTKISGAVWAIRKGRCMDNCLIDLIEPKENTNE